MGESAPTTENSAQEHERLPERAPERREPERRDSWGRSAMAGSINLGSLLIGLAIGAALLGTLVVVLRPRPQPAGPTPQDLMALPAMNNEEVWSWVDYRGRERSFVIHRRVRYGD